MKKLLSIFGTMALTTTASTSAIACDKEPEAPEQPTTQPEVPNNPPTGQPEAPQAPLPQTPVPEAPQDTTGVPEVAEIRLNEQVAKDLGLIDDKGESLVEVGINDMLAPDSVKWDFIAKNQRNPFSNNNNVETIKALKLLKYDNTAVSKESENFLINTLKLKKDDTDNTFNRDDARNITISISEIKPSLSKTKYRNGYETYKITGGTFKLQFVKGPEKLGDNYTIDLKGNELNINSLLDKFLFNKDDFNTIPGFKVGDYSNDIEIFREVEAYTFLKKDSDVYKKLKSLNKLLIDTGDKVSIKVLNIITENWNGFEDTGFWQDSINNYLFLKLYFGTITSSNVIQLYPSL